MDVRTFSLSDAKKPKLRCLLRLKINKNYWNNFGEFIIKIISPNKKCVGIIV